MKLLSSFAFVFVLTAGLLAQSPSKVISQANKALGGEKPLKAITSWQQTGKITRVSDGAAGNYSAFGSGGTFYGGMYDLNGFEVAYGYNGKSGWIRDSKNGLKTLTGEAGNAFQAEAVYRNTRWLRAKDEKSKLTAGGTATVNGKPANVVVLTTAKAVKLKLFFDAATGMLVREEVPQGGKSFEYSDHRVVNGVPTPFAFRFADGDETYDVKLDDVKYNVAVARSSFDFPKMAGEPLPDIPSLLNEIRANADKVDEILENYSYTETRIDRDLNSNGDFVVKGSEKRSYTFYKGYRISRTLEKNNKPLSASDQAKEDRDVEKQVAEIEKKIAEKEKKAVAAGVVGQPKGEGQRITIAESLKGSLLTNPRRERFKNRDVIVFDYEPNPAFKPQTRNEKLFALCNGAVWVDTATKQVVRLEAVLTQSAGNFLAKAKRGASFSLENEIVNNEIWLPSQADINLQIKILFAGININNLIKYGDYRRFETEVKDATVGDEKKPD
ncbi:MAG TPA: hypothetical protein PLP21_04080 [Pyrinomonadaceae bacterium]|nr:hypothetical protein [Acidobacteriota bacterium]HQZ95470.1 hypothetical protein [Pyrinomonadaceae bacterium]